MLHKGKFPHHARDGWIGKRGSVAHKVGKNMDVFSEEREVRKRSLLGKTVEGTLNLRMD